MDFPELSARFKEFETFIKPLRIVLAKQEFAGEKNTDAWREVIATNVTENPPDYEYEVRGARFSIAGCLDEFSRVFDSIRYEDVEAVVAKRWQFPTQGPYVKRDSPA